MRNQERREITATFPAFAGQGELKHDQFQVEKGFAAFFARTSVLCLLCLVTYFIHVAQKSGSVLYQTNKLQCYCAHKWVGNQSPKVTSDIEFEFKKGENKNR